MPLLFPHFLHENIRSLECFFEMMLYMYFQLMHIAFLGVHSTCTCILYFHSFSVHCNVHWTLEKAKNFFSPWSFCINVIRSSWPALRDPNVSCLDLIINMQIILPCLPLLKIFLISTNVQSSCKCVSLKMGQGFLITSIVVLEIYH